MITKDAFVYFLIWIHSQYIHMYIVCMYVWYAFVCQNPMSAADVERKQLA